MLKTKIIPEFLNIPYSLIIDDKLSPLDLKVYGIVLWFRNTTKLKKCFVKNITIALLLSSKERKITENSIQISLSRLEKNKYIKKSYTNKQKTHRKEISIIDNKTALSNGRAKDKQPFHMEGSALSNGRATALSYERDSNKDKSNKNIDTKTHTSFSEKISLKILKYYSFTISKITTSAKLVMTKKANKVISESLKDYEPLDLILAVKGFSEDTWQMEKNGFRGVEWFFSDTKRLGQYIGLFNQNCDKIFIKEAKKFLEK